MKKLLTTTLLCLSVTASAQTCPELTGNYANCKILNLTEEGIPSGPPSLDGKVYKIKQEEGPLGFNFYQIKELFNSDPEQYINPLETVVVGETRILTSRFDESETVKVEVSCTESNALKVVSVQSMFAPELGEMANMKITIELSKDGGDLVKSIKNKITEGPETIESELLYKCSKE